ncbi:MAG: YihY/virulence factor BrkB family protein [Solirubrobacterales bacterium]|nr:YihY/virulence factor BrkB family protein [Solirubrobacterales bacterium]
MDTAPQPGDIVPDRPSPPRVAWLALKRFLDHGMTDNAASLTYFAMLSLFPALLMVVSLLSLLGSPQLPADAAQYLADNGAAPNTVNSVRDVLDTMVRTSSGQSILTFVVAVALALNGASGAYAAAGRALNKVNGVDEDRSFLRRKVTDLAATLVVLLLLVLVLVALFLGGGIADDLFGTIGLGSTGAAVWSVARWPAAFGAALLAYAIVYAFAPDAEPRRLRWLSPGAIVAVLVWLVGSAGFGLFLKASPGYGAAYGAFTAAILLLLWLYITTNAFLYGAELNATIRRLELTADGGPPFPTPPPAQVGGLPGATASSPGATPSAG